jgi:CxxC motif-containing protein (DUF1111 family)
MSSSSPIARRALALALSVAVPLAVSFAFAGEGNSLPPVGSPGGPSRPLTPPQAAQWLRGRAVFDHAFHKSEGVGTPEMNADSCRACHRDPVLGGAGGIDFNVSRFGRVEFGGFQDLPGGQVASRLRPPYVAGREEYDEALANVFEQRQTPTLLGAGLLDSVPEAEILSREDPLDLDGDGVRGVARRIDVAGAIEIGRFGWKAQVPRLRDFVKNALGSENGITSSDDGRGFTITSDTDAVADPELADEQVDELAFFLGNVAAPARATVGNAQIASGEALFETIGCAKCHVPALAGLDGPVPAYSDLLLHDVMVPSFRGMAEPSADMGVYRTPPLWGLRDTAPYLHDGRAETIQDAIAVHASEAEGARQAFFALPQADREAVLAFLNDL